MESFETNPILIRLYKQDLNRIIDRLTFPLAPRWACTVHKTHVSLDNIVISLERYL